MTHPTDLSHTVCRSWWLALSAVAAPAESVKGEFGGLDFVIHAVAYSPRGAGVVGALPGPPTWDHAASAHGSPAREAPVSYARACGTLPCAVT